VQQVPPNFRRRPLPSSVRSEGPVCATGPTAFYWSLAPRFPTFHPRLFPPPSAFPFLARFPCPFLETPAKVSLTDTAKIFSPSLPEVLPYGLWPPRCTQLPPDPGLYSEVMRKISASCFRDFLNLFQIGLRQAEMRVTVHSFFRISSHFSVGGICSWWILKSSLFFFPYVNTPSFFLLRYDNGFRALPRAVSRPSKTILLSSLALIGRVRTLPRSASPI